MKRSGNLYDQIGERFNLELAYWRAQRGKSHKSEVQMFREHLDEELERMRIELQDGTVYFGDYSYFTIYDPKERIICAASFRERVLHHAIMAVCGSVFDKYQIDDSFASREGKGVDACLKRTCEFCRRYRWYLKLDVRKFFDSINHSVLKSLLNRRFKDQRLLGIFFKIIDSYETRDDCGIPIGNLTSQFFANLYLGGMDHMIKDRWRVPGYVRYMDDFILFADEPDILKNCHIKLTEMLKEELKLELHEPIMNRCSFGIPYLNYRILPNEMRLSLEAKRRFRRKISIANAREDSDMALALLAFINRADSYNFRKSIFQGT